MAIATPVLPLNSQVLPGHNQATFHRLRQAVQAIPPHHFWLATCDDLPLQRQLAATLEESLQADTQMGSTQLLLNAEVFDLAQQIRDWIHQSVLPLPSVLQILGIEQFTHCGSDAQYEFLQSLHQLLPLWQQLGCSLLIWLPRPWLRRIRREVPELDAMVFEFIGDPTPISEISNHQAYQAAFSPVRRWQFLGKPAPEIPPQQKESRQDALSVAPEAIAVPNVPTDEEPDLPEAALKDAEPPTFSEELWHQLEADLNQFESGGGAFEGGPVDRKDRQGDAALAETSDFRVHPLKEARVETAPPELDDVSTEEQPWSPIGAAAEGDAITEGATIHGGWNLAYRLRDRIQTGDHSPTTLEAAIRAYEQLDPYNVTTPQRTEVLNDLGSLYWLWAQQATTIDGYFQRLLTSSKLYEDALAPVSLEAEASLLNRLHSNLGSVYSLLAAQKDPLQYLGKAVRAFHRALQYVSAESMTEEYATLQTHLGTAYWSLAQQTQEATHLHRAIAAYQEALRHSNPQQMPLAYAQLQNNLGIALWSLSRHERPVFLLEQAIGAYRTALAYRTIDAEPGGCAATHNNLGTAYWDLGGHCEERSLEQQQAWKQAISAYETAILALQHSSMESLSFDRWATHHSVGVVYDQLAIALAPDTVAQSSLLLKAMPHYIKALLGWQAIEATTAETAFQALVRNLQLQARYLGVDVQQRSLNQIPANWLPDIMRQL